MNAQLYAVQGGPISRSFGQPLTTPRAAGVLTVLTGEVWLTRHADLRDHVLVAGDRMRLERADRALVEPLRPGVGASWTWEPLPARADGWRDPRRDAQRGRRRRVALALPAAGRGLAALLLRLVAALAGGLAGGLRRAEDALEALARSAASTARRAQGCIKAGESIASTGGVQ